MNVAVRKSSPVPVRPTEPLRTTTITMRGTIIMLTSFDRVLLKVPSTILLVFEHVGYEAIEI